jgi:hypothetical protein
MVSLLADVILTPSDKIFVAWRKNNTSAGYLMVVKSEHEA